MRSVLPVKKKEKRGGKKSIKMDHGREGIRSKKMTTKREKKKKRVPMNKFIPSPSLGTSTP